jgi:hypothetical protein
MVRFLSSRDWKWEGGEGGGELDTFVFRHPSNQTLKPFTCRLLLIFKRLKNKIVGFCAGVPFFPRIERACLCVSLYEMKKCLKVALKCP